MKKKMRKVTGLLLCCILVIGMVVGCGSKNTDKETKAKKETEKKVENALEGTVWNYEEMELHFKADMTVDIVDVEYNDFEKMDYTWDSKKEEGTITDGTESVIVKIEGDRLRVEDDGEGMFLNKGPADTEAFRQTETEMETEEDESVDEPTFEYLEGSWYNDTLEVYFDFIDETTVVYDDPTSTIPGSYTIDGEDIYIEFPDLELSLSGFIDDDGDLAIIELEGWFVKE